MSEAVRSEGWKTRRGAAGTARPSFTTLLVDEAALTLLADSVALQLPRDVLASVTVSSRGVVRIPTTPYGPITLTSPRDDAAQTVLSALRAAGARSRERTVSGRPLAILTATVIAVTVPFALLTSDVKLHTQEVQSALLRLSDMPAGFAVQTVGVMPAFFPYPNRVQVPTTTTTPRHLNAADRAWARRQAAFEACIGTTHRTDRTVGLAAQPPEVFASAPSFASNEVDGGLGSMVQWYASTDDVRRDTEQMRRPHFATCLATMYAQTYLYFSGTIGVQRSAVITTVPLHRSVFATTFHREGTVRLHVSDGGDLYFTTSVITTGHYEAAILFISTSLRGVANVVNSVVAAQSSRLVGDGISAA